MTGLSVPEHVVVVTVNVMSIVPNLLPMNLTIEQIELIGTVNKLALLSQSQLFKTVIQIYVHQFG